MAEGLSGEVIPSHEEIEARSTAHALRVHRFAMAVLTIGATGAGIALLYYGALFALGISVPFLFAAFSTLSSLALGLSLLLTAYNVLGSMHYSRLKRLNRRAERARLV